MLSNELRQNYSRLCLLTPLSITSLADCRTLQLIEEHLAPSLLMQMLHRSDRKLSTAMLRLTVQHWPILALMSRQYKS